MSRCGAIPQRLKRLVLLSCLACAVLTLEGSALAQRRRWHDEGFTFRRIVEVPAGTEPLPEVLVSEFFTHEALNPEAPELAVYANRDLAASTILQVGPGDFCRVALRTIRGQTRYTVYYGGRSTGEDGPPPWTPAVGLLFETRRWRACDLNRFDSVRKAFSESVRIGADLVPQVFHRHNPFDSDLAPFLSRYVGEIHVPQSGTCTFFISSQDCSFVRTSSRGSWSGAPG